MACFAALEDMRSLDYYPVFLQSITDFISVGIASLTSGIININVPYKANDFLMFSTRDPTEVQGRIICVCQFGYTIVNKYSTPFTMLAIAMQRFYQICYPFDANTPRGEKIWRIICSVVTVVPITLIAPEFIYVAWRGFPFEDRRKTKGLQGTICELGLLEHNPKVRRVFNGLVFWFLPAVVCFILYARVGTTLRSMVTRRGRNRLLTILFLVSCLAWFIFWLPEHLVFATLDVELFLLSNPKAGTGFAVFYLYFSLLFSATQPLVLIVCYRPLWKPILGLIKKLEKCVKRNQEEEHRGG